MSPRRAILALPGIVMLLAATMFAVQRGRADSLLYDASAEIATWVSSGATPISGTWESVRADLASANRLLPEDPVALELLGLLHSRRHGHPEIVAEAEQWFNQALARRPSSGYTWANIAELMYWRGETSKPFEAVLIRAMEFGPGEPEVQRTVANLGLAVFDEIGVSARAAVDRAVGSGMRRNALEMMQISGRRGRLDVACRHATSIQSSAHQEWFQLCQQ